jgi:hypothetical protein
MAGPLSPRSRPWSGNKDSGHAAWMRKARPPPCLIGTSFAQGCSPTPAEKEPLEDTPHTGQLTAAVVVDVQFIYSGRLVRRHGRVPFQMQSACTTTIRIRADIGVTPQNTERQVAVGVKAAVAILCGTGQSCFYTCMHNILALIRCKKQFVAKTAHHHGRTSL